MAHAVRDKTKLLNRIRRIRGQVTAIEALLESEAECGRVLHTIAACRGAIDSLQAEVLEDHIRYHVVDPEADPESEQVQAAEELVDLLRSYLK
ncbi:MAG TPA: metal/formaldehyde-sensitive transcriptional repressor [Gemmatimonadales bacterium]|jgi:DNA-binding FrmR family transcriptional regulator|nr:metal/formaldehyde-sensitive transcriptional repressor [Gemmatimonadales bacterium]